MSKLTDPKCRRLVELLDEFFSTTGLSISVVDQHAVLRVMYRDQSGRRVSSFVGVSDVSEGDGPLNGPTPSAALLAALIDLLDLRLRQSHIPDRHAAQPPVPRTVIRRGQAANVGSMGRARSVAAVAAADAAP